VSRYQVIVLDTEGCTITHTEERGLTAAKRSAREKLAEPGYSDAHKVEVQTEAGECVWDRFYERGAS
jgi:hypothetical protein